MNNRGWGLTQMLILSSILLIALFVAAINVKREEHNLKHEDANIEHKVNNTSEDNISSNYSNLEKMMVESAQKLVENKSVSVDKDIVIVKKEHLYEHNVDLKKEFDKYDCNGYTSIYMEDGNTHYKPYIKCGTYETYGYDNVYE